MCNSDAITRSIQVKVESSYIPDRSEPHAKRWFFAYRIRVRNHGDVTVQLVSRHWIITDANGQVEEVKGPGVVGKQPVLAPGEAFEYTSFCTLQTAFGTMEGSYEMIVDDGERFNAEIAQFSLSQPLAVN